MRWNISIEWPSCLAQKAGFIPFPPQIWDNIPKVLQNFSALPLWVNTDLSLTVFGGKQNNIFWKTVFESCKTPQGMVVLAKPINLIDMIK